MAKGITEALGSDDGATGNGVDEFALHNNFMKSCSDDLLGLAVSSEKRPKKSSANSRKSSMLLWASWMNCLVETFPPHGAAEWTATESNGSNCMEFGWETVIFCW
jgi:hypothetical protein